MMTTKLFVIVNVLIYYIRIHIYYIDASITEHTSTIVIFIMRIMEWQ
jgi:hypothetical protein